MVSPENCDLAQRNFCATLTNLQISAIFAVTSNFCAISYAYVQFGLALLRPPIIFDRLSMPKIDRLTGKPTVVNRERKCADTTGTVLVPWAGHFQC